MPTPQSDETFDEWIERCMASDEANEDFPDDAQRYAFCVSRWEQQQDNAMTKPGIEHRVRGEVRAEAVPDGDGRRLVGYAALFNTPADIAGMFREQIAPGAFTQAIQRDDVRALVNHDANMVLGRNKAGTLRLSEDDKGLRVEVDMPDTQMARDLGVSMERGDINQMSFGFIVKREEFTDEEPPLRTIREAELFDVSVVTYPAYEETEVGLRSLRKHRQEQRGTNLGAALEVAIADMEQPRGEVVGEMAQNAGIDRTTVYKHINGGIMCPTLGELEAYAEVLQLDTQALVTAAQQDGCDYSRPQQNSKTLARITRKRDFVRRLTGASAR